MYTKLEESGQKSAYLPHYLGMLTGQVPVGTSAPKFASPKQREVAGILMLSSIVTY